MLLEMRDLGMLLGSSSGRLLESLEFFFSLLVLLTCPSSRPPACLSFPSFFFSFLSNWTNPRTNGRTHGQILLLGQLVA
ncbi:hypothetical protein BKA80DRAFT_274096 [Phyllosticta citrichinensis]